MQQYRKTGFNTQRQTTTWPLLIRVVVMVQLSRACSPVEVVVAALSKAVVLRKIWSSCGRSCPSLVVHWW